MNPFALHLLQQRTQWHRWWHINQRTDNRLKVELAVRPEPVIQRNVFQMHQAQRVIQRFGINWQTRIRGLPERCNDLIQSRIISYRGNVRCRNRHIIDTHIVHVANVQQHVLRASRRYGQNVVIYYRSVSGFLPEQSPPEPVMRGGGV